MELKIFTAILFILLFSQCSEDEAEPNDEPDTTTELTFGTISLSDVENFGNGADVFISFTLSGGDLSALNELRLIMSKSTEILDDLLQVTSSNCHLLSISNSEQTVLNADLTDVDGDLVVEGESYNVYLLGILDEGDPLLSDAASILLSNEILVTTPELTGDFNGSEDIVIASNGTLYANEGSTGSNLYKITPAGQSTILNSTLSGPVGIALDADENILVSNFGGTVIKKITPTGLASDYVSDGRLVGGGGLAVDNDGNLFNTFWATTTLYRINEGAVQEFTTDASFDGPVGITYDSDRGNLYVASFNNGKIFHVAEDGSVTEVADTPANIGHISYARDHFYVTGWNQHQVYKVSLDGEITATIGSGSNSNRDGLADVASFVSPNGIEATSNGQYLYVTQADGELRKIILERED